MSSIRHRRPSSAYVPYPAVVLDQSVLDQFGVIAGTRPDEIPPKVVMTRADWDKLIARPRLARQALSFLGTTWEENPLIAAPVDAEPPKPLSRYKPGRKRRPGPFDYLKALPTDEAVALARKEHEERLAAGSDPISSMQTLLRALVVIRKSAEERAIVAAPLQEPAPGPNGEPPLRDHFVVRYKRDRSLWTARRLITEEDYTLTAHEGGQIRVGIGPRELGKRYERVGEAVALGA